MKRFFLIIMFIPFAVIASAQFQTSPHNKGSEYFRNPIFAGDYPDPSILRDGDTYYMVHSSFEYYPGLLIWQSTDLIHWTPVVNALHKYIGSVWAPDLVKYNGKYYIYFPANNDNYVVSADDINGAWSEPIKLNISSIDPGHFVDENGKRYLYFSNGGYVPLSDDGLSVTGEMVHAYDGWEIPREWTIECFCLESPKIAKHGDYYYLTVAEGGTAGPATSHMIISARSKSPLGPWENSPYNPIDRTLSSTERWWSKGHGTIFEDKAGKWWIIFHAYENGHHNMGRQTLMQPIEWTNDGWFKTPANIKTDRPIKLSSVISSKSTFSLSDNFAGNTLKPHWKFFGEYDTTRFELNNNSIVIKAKGNNVGECSPLLCVPASHSYIADVEMIMEGDAIGGLMLFYDNRFNSGILADSKNVLTNLKGWQFVTESNVHQNHVYLRLKNTNNLVDMFYSTDGENWKKIETSLEVSAIHHNVLGGFLSLRIGLCSIGKGSVRFKNFRYETIE